MGISCSIAKLKSASYTYLGRANSSNITSELPKPRVDYNCLLPPKRCPRLVAGEFLQDDGQITKILGKQQNNKSTDLLAPTALKLEDLLPPKQQMPENSQGEFKYKVKYKYSNNIQLQISLEKTIKIFIFNTYTLLH